VRRAANLWAFVVSAFVLLVACQGTQTVAEPSRSTAVARTVGFASRDKLTEHFLKHGNEFGARDEAAYLKLAQELRDAPAGGNVLEDRRADGVTTRFDRGSGSFIAFNADGTIRTFFKPNDGEQYYRRQLNR
jgi:pyocin large subunit-like protein